MTEVFERDIHDEGRGSSKGNQMKWRTDDGIWYKADGNGYEGLTEYMVSALLAYSSLLPEEYVRYDTEEIVYRHSRFTGCKSRDFLMPGEQTVTKRGSDQIQGDAKKEILRRQTHLYLYTARQKREDKSHRLLSCYFL